MCTIFLFPQEDFSPVCIGEQLGTFCMLQCHFQRAFYPHKVQHPRSCVAPAWGSITSILPGSLKVERGWWPVRSQADPSPWGRPFSAGPCFVLFLCPHPWGRMLFQPGTTSGRLWHPFPALSRGLSAGHCWWDSDSAQSLTVPWLQSGPRTPLGQCLGCSVSEGQCRHGSGMAGGGEYTREPWRFCPRAAAAASALDFPPWGTLPQGALMDRLFQYDRLCME